METYYLEVFIFMESKHKQQTIVVTGETGFLGGSILDLINRKYSSKYCAFGSSHRLNDFCSHRFELDISDIQPNYIIHTAAVSGNILFTQKHPGRIFVDNTIMTMRVLEAARLYKVKRLVLLLSSCSYPDYDRMLFPLDYLENKPHPSVECQAYSKRNAFLAAKYYQQEYGFDALCVCPAGLYGPGGSFDLDKAKVLHCLVKRIVDAKRKNKKKLELMGTGHERRQFCYIDDAAELIVQSLKVKKPPVNILNYGEVADYSISELADMIATITDYNGKIVFKSRVMVGQGIKKLVISNPTFEYTSIDTGLRKTIEYYEQNF